MRVALVALLIACDAGPKPAPAPVPVAAVVAADAAVAVAPPIDAPRSPGPTLLRPVGMTGPFKLIDDACASATPCGFTVMDDRGNETTPPTEAGCAMGASDPNGVAPRSAGQLVELDHTTPSGLELRIASQSCAVPKGARGEEDVYYMFVRRADGWWRSDALWDFSYNDKYVSGAMTTRWNDQPNATFVGIAASLDELDCNKQGLSLVTDELMVRVEAGSAHPLVWAPIEVGRRYQQEKAGWGAPDADCPTKKTAHELAETWTSRDDLQLTGSASWESAQDVRYGVMVIGMNGGLSDTPVAASYRFVR